MMGDKYFRSMKNALGYGFTWSLLRVYDALLALLLASII